MPSLQDSLRSVRERASSYRTVKLMQQTRATPQLAFANSRYGNNMFGAGAESNAKSTRQYNAYRGLQYTSIKAIATKIAGQPISVGRKSTHAAGALMRGLLPKCGPELFLKGMRTRIAGFEGGAMGRAVQTKDYETAPDFVRKDFDESSYEILEKHPIIDDFAYPNNYMTKWQLFYCTVASIQLTGRAYWWIIPREDGVGRFSYYYIPANWVEPVHEPTPFAAWKIQPPSMSTPMPPVPRDEIVYFALPDPANPLNAYSPTQALNRPINTDEQIQDAQYMSMKNVMNPKVVLTAGRLPDMNGRQNGPRPVLTPEQRTDLIEAIKMAHMGVSNYGEPVIIDGLIESVSPYMSNPADLDFPNGSKLTKSRIEQGYGVNPIVTGEIQGANRASAYVAHAGFNEMVVNPLETLMSEVMTRDIGSRYRGPQQATALWIQKSVAYDPDLVISRVQMALPAMTKGELRRFAATGKLDLPPRPDDDDPAVPPPPNPMEVGTKPGGAPANPPSAKPKSKPKTPSRKES